MFKKSKYDIMNKEMKRTTLSIMELLIKVSKLDRKVKKGKMSEEQKDVEMGTALLDILPLIKKGCHVLYENNMDLESIDKEHLLQYIEEKGINCIQFSYNYAKIKKSTTQVLMLFALLDKDNIQLSNFDNPEVALKLLDGESSDDILDDVCDKLSDKSADMLSNILDDDFELNDLSEDDVQFLRNYHNRYMAQNIYPKVTKQVTEDEIFKMAKTLGRRK